MVGNDDVACFGRLGRVEVLPESGKGFGARELCPAVDAGPLFGEKAGGRGRWFGWSEVALLELGDAGEELDELDWGKLWLRLDGGYNFVAESCEGCE